MANKIIVTERNNVVKVTQKNNVVVVRGKGARGLRGSTIYSGSTNPSSSLGIIGDYYINTTNARLYGPKESTIWNLNQYIGLGGTSGSPGTSFLTGNNYPSDALGNNGDTYLDLASSLIYTKSGGTWINPTPLVSPSVQSFTYEKQSAGNLWNITHNLGFRPSINVMDYGSINVECDIEHIDENRVRLTFSEPISGYAYLS